MLGAIIGDIVGSRFEFGPAPEKGFKLFTDECNYTDDTICTIAIADAIMNKRGYGEALHDWCRRYPVPMGGYGSRFHDWVESDDPKPYGSFGNGAAMRVSAVAWLYSDYQDVKEQSVETARPTHNHPEGLKGAQCIATLAYWLRTCRITKDEVEAKAWKLWGYEIPSIRDVNRIGAQNHFDGTCMETVPMAIRCFLESQNFEEAIRYAVMADGDTDTKAAITGTLAEAFYEVPMKLIEKALSYLPADMLDIVNQYYERLEAKLK